MNINITNPIFHDEGKATAHLEASRWPNGVNWPHCGSVRVRRIEGKCLTYRQTAALAA